MDLKAGLWQQQTLKLTMTQELTQAIALLQYSTQELTSFLETKALENPLLQVDTGNIRTMDPRLDRVKNNRKRVEKDKQSWIEQLGTNKQTSLIDIIYSQINIKEFSDRQLKIMKELLAHIDVNGYLHGTIQEISARLKITDQEVEQCLTIIHNLEPAGIGARNLQECLLLQVRRHHKNNELAEIIISEHFTLFAEKKWKELSKLLGVSLSEIQQVFDFVQTLNPKPAATYQDDPAVYITPDIIVRWENDSLTINIFDETLPKVTFNEEYFQQFRSHNDQQVNRFLQEKQQDYQWIMKSLEQRKQTLTKVAIKIVEKQNDFFVKGPSYLNPMTMREVSEELGIHESTVSRAVREKYVQTPFGTFELKSFFSSTIQTTTNEATSSKQVKNAISKLIESEDKLKPLSDQEIVEILKDKEGMVVSRRTIAKYRDQLGIPSSTKRKRYD
ncbi:RNA polymerase factor sigma-54 [Bacillus sp. 31A1R]|uniref:RNA polymerase factor sigma-54 n=1 Tax=Robertmurraya mangrovi TaxID=3098077 RepID=A0ABU5IYL0_9BACI|nr:RNA polymerase factor sigma-54 [Bacillus sp. 31A1R]MDZ5472221.1 RNA polymerase factor sigma-54 [Bacillus sp. 31A1R]